MVKCDTCGAETREVVPFLRPPATQAMKILWHEMPLPRSALAVLDPEREASIPWGEHPDDDRIGNACPSCASKMLA